MLKTEDFTLIFQHLPECYCIYAFLSDPYYCINLTKYSPKLAKLKEFYFVTKSQSTDGWNTWIFANSNMTVNIS